MRWGPSGPAANSPLCEVPMNLAADILAVAAATVVLTGAGGCAASGRAPGWASALSYQPHELYPLRVGRFGVPYIPVTINDQSLQLELDTGCMTGLALAPAITRRLQLPLVDQYTSFNSDGRNLGRYPVREVDEALVLGEKWNHEKAYELANDDVSGLIGPRYLLKKRITFDYRAGCIGVSDAPAPPLPPGAEVLPLLAVAGLPGMVVVQGQVNGQTVIVQLDTGKSRTCVSRGLAAMQKLPIARNGFRIETLRIGSLTMAVPSAKPVEFGGISAGLPEAIGVGVGSDVLSRAIWTIDYPNGRVVLMR